MPIAPTRPFRLLRRFWLLAALAIGAIAVLNALAIARFLEQQLFQREADLSRDFVHNVLHADGSLAYVRGDTSPPQRERFDGSMRHLSQLRDVLRANVYTADRRLLWSSEAGLAGQRFVDNQELERALRGELVVHAGRLDAAVAKREHQGLERSAAYFIETYIPVQEGPGVVAVVELYKTPLALTEALQASQRWVAGAAALGALLLAGMLGGLVWRADRVLQRQHQQLAEAQTRVALGELAASVAHNIRNPLASVRSSAELALASPGEPASGWAQDILHDADRIRDRIDALLRLGAPEPAAAAPAPQAIAPLLQERVDGQRPRFERRGLVLALELPADAQAWSVQGDARPLAEALDSLLSNAAEALGAGGRCRVQLARGPRRGWLRVQVHDDGPGIAPERLAAVQRPFVSGKPQGLGLGLPLARMAVERLGGRFTLDSAPGRGTTVTLDLPGG